MLSVQEAQMLIHQRISSLPIEEIDLHKAANRILAKPIIAEEDFPPFTRSAMDGYAINASDTSNEFQVIETLHAGQKPHHALTSGTCARIFTGAALPPNANCVIKQEDVNILDENIKIAPSLRITNHNLRKNGEDFHKGTILKLLFFRLVMN